MKKKVKDFKVSRDDKERMKEEIKKFFYEERDEEIGDLASELVLEFFIEKLAKDFYNLGVNDAKSYFEERIENVLEIQK